MTQQEWSASRDRLALMREELPTRPYAQRIELGVVDPRSGEVRRVHGAIAVSPGRAARLVLAGAGGAPAADVWVTRERFHVSIPSIRLVCRGADLDEAPPLALGLLRWWFVAPLDGHLLVARSSRFESSFVLRDGPATVTMRTNGDHTVAVRRERGRLEGLEWAGHGFVPHAGTRGEYIDGERGLRVFVLLGEVLAAEPDPETFEDPDARDPSTLRPIDLSTPL